MLGEVGWGFLEWGCDGINDFSKLAGIKDLTNEFSDIVTSLLIG